MASSIKKLDYFANKVKYFSVVKQSRYLEHLPYNLRFKPDPPPRGRASCRRFSRPEEVRVVPVDWLSGRLRKIPEVLIRPQVEVRNVIGSNPSDPRPAIHANNIRYYGYA